MVFHQEPIPRVSSRTQPPKSKIMIHHLNNLWPMFKLWKHLPKQLTGWNGFLMEPVVLQRTLFWNPTFYECKWKSNGERQMRDMMKDVTARWEQCRDVTCSGQAWVPYQASGQLRTCGQRWGRAGCTRGHPCLATGCNDTGAPSAHSGPAPSGSPSHPEWKRRFCVSKTLTF